MTLDLVLRGGRVIDPATGRDGVFDIGVAQGKILAIEPVIPDSAGAAQVIDVAGCVVTAGLIDTHAHVYQHVTGKFGLNPDLCGVDFGVTTLVDQGGPSCMTIGGFRNFIVKPAKTRVLCFISAYLVGGLEGHLYPDLYGPNQLNVEHTVRVARENRDIVRGIKAHAEIGGGLALGLEVIKIGKKIARESGLPLYIHLGQLWPEADGVTIPPDEVVEALVPIMEPGDVLAHPFTRHPGGFISTRTGEVHPVVWAALERGVTVDVGHGSHFSFEMARRVISAGIKPTTLGADMHGYNVRVPDADDMEERSANPFFGVAPFNLHNAMSKILTLGMTLDEVIGTVTSGPAKMLGLTESIGSLQVGREADVAVLRLLKGRFDLSDNSGEHVIASEIVTPAFSLRAGRRHDVTSPLVPKPLEVAA